jgi:hypothetical protein
MALNNKYILRPRIPEAKFRQLVRLFCVDLNATQIARVVGLNRNTVNSCSREYENELPLPVKLNRPLLEKLRLMKAIFAACSLEGTTGRGTKGKSILFGLFKRHRHVSTKNVPDCPKPRYRAPFAVNATTFLAHPDQLARTDSFKAF